MLICLIFFGFLGRFKSWQACLPYRAVVAAAAATERLEPQLRSEPVAMATIGAPLSSFTWHKYQDSFYFPFLHVVHDCISPSQVWDETTGAAKGQHLLAWHDFSCIALSEKGSHCLAISVSKWFVLCD